MEQSRQQSAWGEKSEVRGHREVRMADPSTGQTVQRCWLNIAQTLVWFSPSVLADLSQVLTAGEISKIPSNRAMEGPAQRGLFDTDTPRILSGRICWLINTTWWNTRLGFLESVWRFHASQPHHYRRCRNSHSSSITTNLTLLYLSLRAGMEEGEILSSTVLDLFAISIKI